jgi:UDP-N-acetyl-2-amino-2-deoxyglucuronate dehydrogenase
MSSAPLGFGLLGAGLIAPFHARALQASGKARLAAVCDTDAARLARFCGEFDCAGHATLDEMLENPSVDAVGILTPNHLHLDALLRSIAKGKHVVVEKPPAITLCELEEMDRAARAAGVKVGVMLQCRARKAVQAIRRAIGQGRFGKLRHADAYMKWFRPADYYHMDAWRSLRTAGAGVTVQQAFHYIDLLTHLAGPVRAVQARMSNLAHPGVDLEDSVLAFLDFECGAQGVLQASTALWPGTDVRIEINGEHGTAILVGERLQTWRFREEYAEDDEVRSYGVETAATGATGAADLGFRDHQVVIEDLVDAVRSGAEPMIPLLSVGPTLECVLAMYRSSREGAAVELPIPTDSVIV